MSEPSTRANKGSEPSDSLPLPARANLGCGGDYRDGWHNVDERGEIPVDQRVDLDDRPWPWADDSFEHVLMDNVIEHLDDRLETLRELHRVVEPGGTVTLRFPHWNSPGHFTCPSHTKTLTHRTPENYEVAHLFDLETVDCQRVRFGRALPKPVALWLGDHVGHLVSEVELQLQVRGTGGMRR